MWPSFGKYVKFYVKKVSASPDPSRRLPNAFQILMASQARRMSQTLPSMITEPRNKKEELHNAIIQFCEKDNLCWTPSELTPIMLHVYLGSMR